MRRKQQARDSIAVGVTNTDNVRFTDGDINEFESHPRTYGGVELTANEDAALSLPPKFAVFKRIDPLVTKAQIEKSFAKMRWKLEIVSDEEDENDKFYSTDENNFDLSRMRATDLPYNKTVKMPPYADEETEVKLNYAKSELCRLADKYSQEKNENNINIDVRKGLSSLTSMINDNRIICYPTDKSGRMSVDTLENYEMSIQPHLSTQEASEGEYLKTEKVLNAHMTAWCNIMQSSDRVRNNFISVNNKVPPIYGLRKDHKIHDDPIEGPPTRPVCGANVSSSRRISNFLSMILKPFLNASTTSCESTKDLLSQVSLANCRKNLDKAIIGSMDVKALYPSINVDFAVERCLEIIKESDTEFNNIDTDELGLFIALTSTKENPVPTAVQNLCPTREKSQGKPTLTGTVLGKSYGSRWSGWRKCDKQPFSTQQIHEMVTFALGTTLRTVLKNHIYTFNNKCYKQLEGGAIGVAIAGDVAVLFMSWWDKELLQRLSQEHVMTHLYSRYVDDINILVDSEMVCEGADRTTMERIQIIANEIHPSIQVTIDYPSIHENKRLPVLDLEMWMEEVATETGGTTMQVLHSHHMKAIASKHVVNSKSALSRNTKNNILVSELVRIQRNISLHCSTMERRKHIQHFLDRMQFSGYSGRERITIYNRAKIRFNKMVEEDRCGTCPLYRSKNWNKTAREKTKREKRNSWFKGKNNQYKTTMFVDATPNSILANSFQRVLNTAKIPIKVVENAGTSIRRLLSKSNPFRPNSCSDNNCTVCCRADNTDCKTRDCLYELKCECGDKYIGETSRSLRERVSEHISGLNSKSDDNVLSRHMLHRHTGATKSISVSVLATYPDDAMGRQIAESVYIAELKPSINAREEWGNKNRPRKRTQTSLNDVTQ